MTASPESTATTRPRARRSLVLNFVLVFLLGLFLARLPSTIAAIAGSADDMEMISDVRRILRQHYVEKPADDKLAKGAIDGMLESLDDPYAEFIPPEDAEDFEKSLTGTFSGIGCQIDSRDGWLYVVSPIEDSPAFNAGILAGDKIIKVNGESTFNVSTDKCIKMITGPEGTTVHLDVIRGDGQELKFDIVRAKIVSKSARGFRRLNDGTGHWDFLIDPQNAIAYVRLSQFTPTSPEEFADGLDQAQEALRSIDPKKEIAGLIFDLRSNPGGLMEAAIAISDMFLDSGTIMSTKGRNQPDIIYKAHSSSDTPKFPIAILVNGASASASEIVSGALSENNRAIVVGTRSFGKGLVQSVQSLPSNPRATVKFTSQRYYLPSGKLIQRTDESAEWGVDPTPGFFIPMSDAETLAWALRTRDWDIIRKENMKLPADIEEPPPFAQQRWSDPDWIATTAKDKQLAGALKAMQAKIAAGPGAEWPKVSDEPDQHGHIALTELKNLEKARERLGKEFARIDKRIDTLEHVASTGKGAMKVPDLWPDSVDPTGGVVLIRDKDGKVIGEFKITGRDIERWIAFSDIEPPPQPAQPEDKSKDAAAKPATDDSKK